MSKVWNTEKIFQLVIEQPPLSTHTDLSERDQRQDWYDAIEATGCIVQRENYFMTLQAMIYRAIGRHRADMLANFEVVASAIIDDRCRKADLEMMSMIGWTVMMLSVEVRRHNTAIETYTKRNFWNEAGRGSNEFETPKCVIRYTRYRPLV